MKPNKIIISGFGPYFNTETIDFAQLEDHQLFLICGQTGAGKTTIFDAIKYALYGEASGMDRKVDSMRSHFAKDETVTFVEYEFTLKNKTYKVKRTPTQLRKKLRGEGYKTENGNAELYCDNKLVETGLKQVTTKVIEIIGLDSSQFGQIVMIAQGEFKKFLLSDTTEKEKVLKTLFNTKKYQELQEKLKTDANELNNKIKSELSAITQLFKTLNPNNSQELIDLLSENKPDDLILKQVEVVNEETKNNTDDLIRQHQTIAKQKDETIKHTQQAINHNNNIHQLEKIKEQVTELKEDSQKIAKLEKKLDNHNKTQTKELIEIVTSLKNYKKELDEKTDTVDNNTITQSSIIQSIEKTKIKHSDLFVERKEEFENLQTQLTKLNSEKQNAELLDEKNKLVDTKETSLNELNLKKDSMIIEIDNKKKDIEKMQNAKQESIKMQLEITQKEKELSYAENMLEKYQDILSIYDLIENLEEDKSNKTEILKGFQKDYEMKEKSFKLAKLNFLQNQSAVLAEELGVGQECPVCGSVEHPKLAKFTKDAVSEGELEILEVAFDKLKSDVQTYELEIKTLTKTINKQHRLLEKKLPDVNLTVIVASKEEVTELILEQERLVFELSSVIKDYSQLIEVNDEIIIDDLKKQLLSDEEAIKELLNTIDTIQKELLELKTVTKGLQERLGVTTTTEFINKLNDVQNKYDELDSSRTSVEKSLNKLLLDEKEVTGEITILKGDIEKIEHSLGVAETEFVKVIGKLDFKTYEEYEEAVLADEVAAEYKEEIEDYHKKKIEIENEQERLIKVIDGKPEIELEQLYLDANRLTEQLDKLNQEIRDLENVVATNERVVTEVLEIKSKISESASKYSLLGELAAVANGRNNNNLSFERYYLASFLDEILVAANRRLLKMTDGRYYLVRLGAVTHKSKQAGLDLNVFDTHNGKERTVRSLSGGECFKASLALALGLSDVIQSFAGGVQIDAMFIDEGFGTLDEESLEQAISCLVDLQNNGRLVGIISHVKQLKDRVGAILEVEKLGYGSTTRFNIK